MRLRNKKTGEIAVIAINTNHNRFTVIGKKGYLYDSLAELNEVWEDYREPKEYWYIVDNDIESDTDDGVDIDKERKAIGNYFETEEEAKKRLINLLIGIAIIAGIMLLFALLIPQLPKWIPELKPAE